MMRTSRMVFLALAMFWPRGSAVADCLKDSRGEVICGRGQCVSDIRGKVFCAKYRYGAVVRMIDGSILCGKGQCTNTMKGQWMCSTAEGGSVFKDWDGAIRCEEACEPASVRDCETSPAGR